MFLSCVIVAALTGGEVSKPSVVYDNTETFLHSGQPLLPEGKNNSAELGDEIVLSGKEREIVELKLRLWYRGTPDGSCDMQVRLRSMVPNTANILNPNVPGPVFYDSGILKNQPTVSGMNEYKFKIPNVKAPDRFLWTMQVYNRKGTVGEVDLPYYNPPTVGSSDDYFWHSEMGSPWIPYSWTGFPVANFAARVTAVAGK